MQAAGRIDRTTQTTDNDDVTFTMHVTSGTDDINIYKLGFSVASTQLTFRHNSITIDSITVDGEGSWDVTCTIPRTLLVELGVSRVV